MDYDQLFSKQFGLKGSTITMIGSFTILWNYFESAKCNSRCTAEKIINMKSGMTNAEKVEVYDNDIERAVKKTHPIFSYLLKKYGNSSEVMSRLAFDSRQGQGVLAGSVSRLLSSEIKPLKDMMQNDKKEYVYVAIMICWRICNNMFHGEKDIYSLNEQYELFNCINEFLIELNGLS